jgi:hypothetical protein
MKRITKNQAKFGLLKEGIKLKTIQEIRGYYQLSCSLPNPLKQKFNDKTEYLVKSKVVKDLIDKLYNKIEFDPKAYDKDVCYSVYGFRNTYVTKNFEHKDYVFTSFTLYQESYKKLEYISRKYNISKSGIVCGLIQEWMEK